MVTFSISTISDLITSSWHLARLRSANSCRAGGWEIFTALVFERGLRLILLWLCCGSDSDSSIHSSLVDLLSLDDFGAHLVYMHNLVYMHKRCIQKITERWSCPQGIFFGTRCGATTLAAARAAPPLPSHSDHV